MSLSGQEGGSCLQPGYSNGIWISNVTTDPWHNFYCCHLPLLNGHCLVPENIHTPRPTGGNRNWKGWGSRRRKFPRGWGWLLEIFSLGAPSKSANYQKQRLCWPSYQLVYCLQSLKIKIIVFINDLLFTVGWVIFLHLTSGCDRLMNKLLVIYLFLYCTIYCGIHGNVVVF